MIQGELLKKYREKNNLSVKDLSKIMHISKKIITLWEEGEKIPFEEDINFLCALYNIDKEDLMSRPNTKKKELKNIKHKNIIFSILIVVISCVLGSIFKSRLISVILSLSLTIIYNSIYYIIDEIRLSKTKRGPKSIFGITLLYKDRKELVKYYMFESLTIASIYLLLSLISYELKIEPLIIGLKFLESDVANMLFIWGTLFILLSGLILVVEIIFGSLLLKKEG